MGILDKIKDQASDLAKDVTASAANTLSNTALSAAADMLGIPSNVRDRALDVYAKDPIVQERLNSLVSSLAPTVMQSVTNGNGIEGIDPSTRALAQSVFEDPEGISRILKLENTPALSAALPQLLNGGITQGMGRNDVNIDVPVPRVVDAIMELGGADNERRDALRQGLEGAAQQNPQLMDVIADATVNSFGSAGQDVVTLAQINATLAQTGQSLAALTEIPAFMDGMGNPNVLDRIVEQAEKQNDFQVALRGGDINASRTTIGMNTMLIEGGANVDLFKKLGIEGHIAPFAATDPVPTGSIDTLATALLPRVQTAITERRAEILTEIRQQGLPPAEQRTALEEAEKAFDERVAKIFGNDPAAQANALGKALDRAIPGDGTQIEAGLNALADQYDVAFDLDDLRRVTEETVKFQVAGQAIAPNYTAMGPQAQMAMPWAMKAMMMGDLTSAQQGQGMFGDFKTMLMQLASGNMNGIMSLMSNDQGLQNAAYSVGNSLGLQMGGAGGLTSGGILAQMNQESFTFSNVNYVKVGENLQHYDAQGNFNPDQKPGDEMKDMIAKATGIEFS